MDNQIIDFRDKIDERSIKILKSTIIAKVKEFRVRNILVSLKYFESIDNPKIMILFIKELETMAIKMKISIDFIDYSEELFAVLKTFTLNTGIQLFKNIDVATLFIKVGAFKEETKVLVFDPNDENGKKLYFDLCKYGYTIDRAHSMQEFLDGINSESYEIVVSRTFLNKRVEKVTAAKSTLSLSKKLIMNLPVFMSKSAETLKSFTGLETEKIAHSIKDFDMSIDEKSISAVMPFKGDLEGYFTLVFPRGVAIVALEALLGETIRPDDTATLKDGVGEFCNIITGATKTEFDLKGIKVVFELPQTYTSLTETQKRIGTNNGVWMDMQLSEKLFYMFVTK